MAGIINMKTELQSQFSLSGFKPPQFMSSQPYHLPTRPEDKLQSRIFSVPG